MAIDAATVRKVAHLARIKTPEDRLEPLAQELNGIMQWIHGWKRNGWKTAAKKPVKNDDLWKELDEAAFVDGASHARVFFSLTLPLVRPILVTVFMVSFVSLFGEFMLASIFLTDVDKQTLGVGLYGMTVNNDRNALFGQFSAGALLSSIPIMALYLAFQKQLIGGLTTGSVK